MLDISRLERIRLSRYPLQHRVIGQLLRINYDCFPGVSIRLENEGRIPDSPSIFAMNHTDRYNYFPFQFILWRRWSRFTATWVKGKYYENVMMGKFMEKMNQLPTISRGYIIARDFLKAAKRTPTREEYSRLRNWVDQADRADGPPECQDLDLSGLPESVLSEPRNVLGRPFYPSQENYADYVNATFYAMMVQFVSLNRQAHELGLEILIFPQGTRSKRLLPSHTGIAELALYLKCPIVPVGCSGSDLLYPGNSPWAKGGECVYRIGEPIRYGSIPEYEIHEKFQPFAPEDQIRHKDRFSKLAAVITDRIDLLLEEPYRLHSGSSNVERSEDASFV